jgi:hypothetical protein
LKGGVLPACRQAGLRGRVVHKFVVSGASLFLELSANYPLVNDASPDQEGQLIQRTAFEKLFDHALFRRGINFHSRLPECGV